MELHELNDALLYLASAQPAGAPTISCYLDTSQGPRHWSRLLDEREALLRRTLSRGEIEPASESFAAIRNYLAGELSPRTRGVALFARHGRLPFFRALEFDVPLPEWIVASDLPNIYHLVELRDTYDRFVVMLSTQDVVRIFEVNLGGVTNELLQEQPELRQRVGREWTKEHYQNHRRDRGDRFLKEKIRVLERLVASGRHTRLVLVGQPAMTARVKAELPKHLAARLFEVVPVANREHLAGILEATLPAFIEREERESREAVERLAGQLGRGGLALAGTIATAGALAQGAVDMVVIAKGYDAIAEPGVDPTARVAIREMIVRLAENSGAHVEVVAESAKLAALGGVGCLLRYRPAALEVDPIAVPSRGEVVGATA